MKAKLGRATDKPGRKNATTLTPIQREAILVFGKYARFNGLIVETKDYADCTELLTHV
jgi:starvation-inducible outer membrane lipoprotein